LAASKPQLIFIAGSNGSGKSTLWKVANFDVCLPFLNVDDKFKELLKADPDATFEEASEWRNNEMARLIKEGTSFVAETVFDKGKLGYIKTARKKGFETTVHFIGLATADLAVERVRDPVRKGGHDVPEDAVRRKWQESLDVANLAARRADSTIFYDNSGDFPNVAAKFRSGKLSEVAERLPLWMLKMPFVREAIEDLRGKCGESESDVPNVD
jgi:predicted ABC-type ATPase